MSGTDALLRYVVSPMAEVAPEQRKEMAEMVREILGPEKAVLWWTTPNPMLGNIAPAWLSSSGTEDKLYRFIKDAYEADQFMPPASPEQQSGDAK